MVIKKRKTIKRRLCLFTLGLVLGLCFSAPKLHQKYSDYYALPSVPNEYQNLFDDYNSLAVSTEKICLRLNEAESYEQNKQLFLMHVEELMWLNECINNHPLSQDRFRGGNKMVESIDSSTEKLFLDTIATTAIKSPELDVWHETKKILNSYGF